MNKIKTKDELNNVKTPNVSNRSVIGRPFTNRKKRLKAKLSLMRRTESPLTSTHKRLLRIEWRFVHDVITRENEFSTFAAFFAWRPRAASTVSRSHHILVVNKTVCTLLCRVANEFGYFVSRFRPSNGHDMSVNDANSVANPFLSSCRVCTQPKQELNNLFTTFMDDNSLADTLALCSQKTVAADDGLSAWICIECLGNLIVAFEFHALCAVSEAKVRQFLIENTPKITADDTADTSVLNDDCCANAADDIVEETKELVHPIECVGKNWRRKTFECLHCKKLFPKMYNLRRHVRIHDETGKPFECTICRWRFSSANNLKRHAIKHTSILTESTTRLQEPTSYSCRLCSRAFQKKESLASHMKIHKNDAFIDNAVGVEKLACELCPKTFTKVGQLTRHMRGHDEMKVHQCNICLKRFARHGMLVDHINRHNNIKPYQCPFCAKSFHQSCTLREHIRTHNGEARMY